MLPSLTSVALLSEPRHVRCCSWHSDVHCKPAMFHMYVLCILAGHLRCDETRQACFCTAECASAAELESGGPNLALRRVLTSVPWDKLNADECNQVRFMMHVLSTRRDSTCSTQTTEVGKKWDQFCKLHALPPDSCSHQRVWEVVKTLVDPDVSHDDVSLCLRKEAANSFGIMAPVGEHVRSISRCAIL